MSKEFELWNCYGAMQREECITLGPHSSFEWNKSRRCLLFTAARYKFAMKMIGNLYEPNEKKILDLGCSDGFGTHFVAEYAASVVGVDFDEEAIRYAIEHNLDGTISYRLDDFLGKKYGDFDGIVSFDVLEHIYPENEPKYMDTVLKNLRDTGTFIVGTPSLETQQYSKSNITGAHVNIYKGENLYAMLKRYFHNVYLFTQNDEIIHTGHLRMANYLIAVCSYKRRGDEFSEEKAHLDD